MIEAVQILIVLDVDVEAFDTDEVWALVSGPFERREVLTLSEHGTPEVHRFREGVQSDQWEAMARSTERLAQRAVAIASDAASSKRRCEFYVCGQAPLSLFAHLGRLLGPSLRLLTLVNRRRDGIWDVISLDAQAPREEVFFNVVSGLDGSARHGRVAIFVSTQGQPAPAQLIADFFRAEDEDLAGIVEIRSSRPAYLDAGNALAAQRQIGEVLSQVSSAYPESSGVALFLAVPAPLAYLVGRMAPNYLGEIWLTNHEYLLDRQAYTRVLPRRPVPHPPPGDLGPIESIDLRNLRLFEHLAISAKPHGYGEGQWIILLGDNGMGKTTILRAVALALVEPELGTILLSKLNAPLHRPDAPAGACSVHARGGEFHTDIMQKGDLEVAQARKGNPARRPLVFGYGCRRGSALGGPQKDVSFLPPTLELATLFDESASLIHAETWLKERALEAEQNKGKPKEALFRTVLATLTGLLPDVNEIEVRDNRVWVDVRGVGCVPLAALSDGYLTLAGWVIDLVARWIDRAARHGDPLEPGFTKTMEGLVLVDEIDLHLHPRWQCQVIADLRVMFPKMSFIVTTHNPLTLLGAREGEIFIFRRSLSEGADGGRVIIEQDDLPKGVRADQVLTGRWFGLSSTLDRDTLDLLERHRKLLRRRGVPEQERRALEAQIRERLGSFADTSLDRLALSVAAELMDERHRELTPEERESLRDEVKRQVKARLDEDAGEG